MKNALENNKPFDKSSVEARIGTQHPSLQVTAIDRGREGFFVVGSKDERDVLVDPVSGNFLTKFEDNLQFGICPSGGLLQVFDKYESKNQGYIELSSGRIVVKPENGSRVEKFYNGAGFVVVDGPNKNPFSDIVRIIDGAKVMHFDPGHFPSISFNSVFFTEDGKNKLIDLDGDKTNILFKVCGFEEVDEIKPIFNELEKKEYVLMGGDSVMVEKASKFLKIKKDSKFGILDLGNKKLLFPIEFDKIIGSDFIPRSVKDGNYKIDEEFEPYVVGIKSNKFYVLTRDGELSDSFENKELAIEYGNKLFNK